MTQAQISRIIEMAWEDRTPFDAIHHQFGLTEAQTIYLMRKELKKSSFEMWRMRMYARSTKHREKRPFKAGNINASYQ